MKERYSYSSSSILFNRLFSMPDEKEEPEDLEQNFFRFAKVLVKHTVLLYRDLFVQLWDAKYTAYQWDCADDASMAVCGVNFVDGRADDGEVLGYFTVAPAKGKMVQEKKLVLTSADGSSFPDVSAYRGQTVWNRV